MIRVGLARTRPSYDGLAPPWGPGKAYPEMERFLGDAAGEGAPNPVYAAVRSALAALGLDGERFGTDAWNPLGTLVGRGASIVLKPNFIRHWNPEEAGSVESVITHGAVVRAVADYALLAAGPEGSVCIAEASQQDCDFAEIRRLAGLDDLVSFYEKAAGAELRVLDLRREVVTFRDGVISERRPLPGDPEGYRAVDLGEKSFFHDSGLDPELLRGADYDPGPTTQHHRDGRNEYLLSETVLRADLIVNLPKWKTHKKTGVTLALKNLVGINGDKNWLPHHCAGGAANGGDEFPGGRLLDRLRSRAAEWARPWLARGRALALFRAARRAEWATRGDDFVRSGNWWGNRTTWRMCLDLNRCVLYSDAVGFHPDAPAPVRTVLTVLDGVVAGEGAGPLAPRDVGLGHVLAATDPVALDLVAVRLMGFDETLIPKIREAMADAGLRVTAVRNPGDVTVAALDESGGLSEERLEALAPARVFAPHPGWRGHIERRQAEAA